MENITVQCVARNRKPRKTTKPRKTETINHIYTFNNEDLTAATKILEDIYEACNRAQVLIRQLREERAAIHALGVENR